MPAHAINNNGALRRPVGKLDGKVVVVTGGARGMGRATAELAAKEGAKVAICDIKDQLGDEAARKIVEAGGTARYYHTDITQRIRCGADFL
jgi:NAD(P)-dependent dehydrogenase (short-subunit alcohol dehydrogenase family)